MKKICPICKTEFEAPRSNQTYCKRDHVKICEICNSEYVVPYKELYRYAEYHTCRNKSCINANRNKSIKQVLASKPKGYNHHKTPYKQKTAEEKAAEAAKEASHSLGTEAVCQACGAKFIKMNAMQKYCRQPRIAHCIICNTEILYLCGETPNATCSNPECIGKYLSQRQKARTLEEWADIHNKMRETIQEKYGVDWYTRSAEYHAKTKETCLKRYGVDHHLKSEEVIEKRVATVQDKYGASNVLASEYGMEKAKETLLAKYNAINCSQVPEFKRKATANSRNSKLELRICSLLNNYNVNYIRHYILKNDMCSHEFDFYLPDYKLLIDADGVYFHSYLSDPDGKAVRDDYDNVRLSLIPPDHEFYLIVEGNEDTQVKSLVKQLEQIDKNLFDYDSKLFEWCRSIDFPYPDYTDKRLITDWSSLCKYRNDTYVPQCRLGESVIKQFHKSIYDCRVKGAVSPKEGWCDDNKLKKVIKNRLIYVNNVDPSKILSGFNISKICPVVSIFNPILAKYLLLKYASNYNQIFDPFSGFSGRLLGAACLGKEYIGQDLNKSAVAESNQIIEFLKLDKDRYSVIHKDILESGGDYQCLLTCPPYNNKEIYSDEIIFKSCDEWITECLRRFNCQLYIFVVDETKMYTEYVQEEISNKSHFSNMHEKVVVIHC